MRLKLITKKGSIFLIILSGIIFVMLMVLFDSGFWFLESMAVHFIGIPLIIALVITCFVAMFITAPSKLKDTTGLLFIVFSASFIVTLIVIFFITASVSFV